MKKMNTFPAMTGYMWLLFVPVILLTGGWITESDANTVNLTFKYTVVQGTCTLEAPPDVNLSTQAAQTDASGAVGQRWKFLATTPFDLVLTSCSGVPDQNTQPAVKLSGFSMMASGSTDRQNMIFTSASNTTGFGLVLSKTPGTAMSDGGSTALLSQTDPYINISGKNSVATNSTLKIYAALACGDAADCAAANLKPGKVDANVSFEFVYH